MAAKAFGATKIAITDVRDDNLALARSYGAKHALLTPPSMSNEEAATLLKGLFPTEGPDCVIDCAGYSSTLNVNFSPPPPSPLLPCLPPYLSLLQRGLLSAVRFHIWPGNGALRSMISPLHPVCPVL